MCTVRQVYAARRTLKSAWPPLPAVCHVQSEGAPGRVAGVHAAQHLATSPQAEPPRTTPAVPLAPTSGAPARARAARSRRARRPAALPWPHRVARPPRDVPCGCGELEPCTPLRLPRSACRALWPRSALAGRRAPARSSRLRQRPCARAAGRGVALLLPERPCLPLPAPRLCAVPHATQPTRRTCACGARQCLPAASLGQVHTRSGRACCAASPEGLRKAPARAAARASRPHVPQQAAAAAAAAVACAPCARPGGGAAAAEPCHDAAQRASEAAYEPAPPVDHVCGSRRPAAAAATAAEPARALTPSPKAIPAAPTPKPASA